MPRARDREQQRPCAGIARIALYLAPLALQPREVVLVAALVRQPHQRGAIRELALARLGRSGEQAFPHRVVAQHHAQREELGGAQLLLHGPRRLGEQAQQHGAGRLVGARPQAYRERGGLLHERVLVVEERHRIGSGAHQRCREHDGGDRALVAGQFVEPLPQDRLGRAAGDLDQRERCGRRGLALSAIELAFEDRRVLRTSEQPDSKRRNDPFEARIAAVVERVDERDATARRTDLGQHDRGVHAHARLAAAHHGLGERRYGPLPDRAQLGARPCARPSLRRGGVAGGARPEPVRADQIADPALGGRIRRAEEDRPGPVPVAVTPGGDGEKEDQEPRAGHAVV
ncbi:MAG: hypothetical protein OER88_11210 [Planctomycetota bacterium]|nr:hypothetical protein [Planctomycetota bacterium]